MGGTTMPLTLQMKMTSWRNSWVCPGNIPRPNQRSLHRRVRPLLLRRKKLWLRPRKQRLRLRNRENVISATLETLIETKHVPIQSLYRPARNYNECELCPTVNVNKAKL